MDNENNNLELTAIPQLGIGNIGLTLTMSPKTEAAARRLDAMISIIGLRSDLEQEIRKTMREFFDLFGGDVLAAAVHEGVNLGYAQRVSEEGDYL